MKEFTIEEIMQGLRDGDEHLGELLREEILFSDEAVFDFVMEAINEVGDKEIADKARALRDKYLNGIIDELKVEEDYR
jgi:hypothetical protein